MFLFIITNITKAFKLSLFIKNHQKHQKSSSIKNGASFIDDAEHSPQQACWRMDSTNKRDCSHQLLLTKIIKIFIHDNHYGLVIGVDLIRSFQAEIDLLAGYCYKNS